VFILKYTSFANLNLLKKMNFKVLQDKLFREIKHINSKQKSTFSIILFVYTTLIVIVLSSCSKKNYSSKPYYQFTSNSGQPEYSNLNYWAAHPQKKDPSDSIPLPLQENISADTAADVFFIHPTTFTSKKDKSLNARVDNLALNAKTDYSTILYQASAFSNGCRVFAPRYRQAHYRTFFTKTGIKNNAFNLAYSDVKAAFETYLAANNNGRPIIIAAHSQGTVHAARLLKEFFENKSLQRQLVCAYLIGMPIADNYFMYLKPCTDSAATGCFVSWRTYKKGYTEPKFVAKETFKAIVTNPLTWRINEDYAATQLNKGGILKNFNKLVPGVVDAQKNGNVLWVRKPKFFGNFLITTKNYHIADINLFYYNIRQNVKVRLESYFTTSQ
jgi:Protein of unknown function (DUF3089)